MDAYIRSHIALGAYRAASFGSDRYENAEGWMDFRVGAHIVFAHRTTDYRIAHFRDALHRHNYCEILFPIRGDVQYVSDDRTEMPCEGRFIVIPPGHLHTTRLLRKDVYERYVLYLSKDAFREFPSALSPFLSPDSETFSGTLDRESRTRALSLLSQIEATLTTERSDPFSAYAALTSLLLLLRDTLSEDPSDLGSERLLPAPVRAIRRYIETEYALIGSIEALAEHFYYSREYVTRLFRRYYNLSPGDYLEQCRIRAAEDRIARGERIADVCFAVGYRSMSAFSAAFRRVTGSSPSAIRKNLKNIHK